MKKNIIILLVLFCLLCCIGCSDIYIIPHKVTFVTNGGTKVDAITVSKIEKAPITYKDNYLLDGWYLDAQFRSVVAFPLNVDKDITLYAKWQQDSGFYYRQSTFISMKFSHTFSYHKTSTVLISKYHNVSFIIP